MDKRVKEFADKTLDKKFNSTWSKLSYDDVQVKLFSHALLSTIKGHETALEQLKKDIELQKQNQVGY